MPRGRALTPSLPRPPPALLPFQVPVTPNLPHLPPPLRTSHGRPKRHRSRKRHRGRDAERGRHQVHGVCRRRLQSVLLRIGHISTRQGLCRPPWRMVVSGCGLTDANGRGGGGGFMAAPGALWRYAPTAAGESDATNPEPSPNREGGSYTCWNWTGTPRSSERSWADREDRCRSLIVLGCVWWPSSSTPHTRRRSWTFSTSVTFTMLARLGASH